MAWLELVTTTEAPQARKQMKSFTVGMCFFKQSNSGLLSVYTESLQTEWPLQITNTHICISLFVNTHKNKSLSYKYAHKEL